MKLKDKEFLKFERSKQLEDKDYEEIEYYKNNVLIKSVRKHKTKDKHE